jgi:hypothetical protein
MLREDQSGGESILSYAVSYQAVNGCVLAHARHSPEAVSDVDAPFSAYPFT